MPDLKPCPFVVSGQCGVPPCNSCFLPCFDVANSNGEPVATKHDDFCSYGEKKEEA